MAGAVDEAAQRSMRGAFSWGTADCLIASADAFLELHGVDPAATVRGKYDSHVGAARILRAAGGFVPWAQVTFAAQGLVVAPPAAGALALISAPRTPFGAVTALSLGNGYFAGKAEQGMAVFAARNIAWVWAWHSS